MAPASGTAQMQQKHARASSEAHVLLMAMHNKNSRARAVLGLPDNVYPADLGAACAAQLGDWDLKPAAMNSARREKSNTKACQFRTYTADDIRDAPEIVPNAHIGAKAKTDREVLLSKSRRSKCGASSGHEDASAQTCQQAMVNSSAQPDAFAM